MAKIEDIPRPTGIRKLFPSTTLCCVDKRVPATKQIVFTYGWGMPLCTDHLAELSKLFRRIDVAEK